MASQSLTIKTITISPTTLSGIKTIAILNSTSSTNIITIKVSGSSDSIHIHKNQTLSLNASTGFVLPDLEVSGTGLTCMVIYS
jgi:hypothetical protein